MNCFEIRIGDNIYQLRNDNNNQSESYIGSDWNVIYSFVTKGKLPEGWNWYTDDSSMSPDEAFSKILQELKDTNSTPLPKINDHDKLNKFINNIVGNDSFRKIGDENDPLIFPERNVLVLQHTSGSNWYGITKDRIVLITSDRNWRHGDYNRIVYDTYNLLKEGNHGIIDAVERLFESVEGNVEGLDIFDKFSILVNNHKDVFGRTFYNPYNREIINVTQTKIKENPSLFMYNYVKLKKSNGKKRFFILKHLDKKASEVRGTILSIDSDGNIEKEDSTIGLKEVVSKKMYSITHANGYMLIDDVWVNQRYQPVNKLKAESLFRKMLLIGNNEYSIDLSSNNILFQDIDNIIKTVSEEDPSSKERYLNAKISILSDEGIFVKDVGSDDFVLNILDENGGVIDSKILSGTSKIKRIILDGHECPELYNEIIYIVSTKKRMSNPILSLLLRSDYPEVRIMTDFDSKSAVQIQKSLSLDKDYDVVVRYGKDPIYYSREFIMELEAAKLLVQKLNSDAGFVDTLNDTPNNVLKQIKKALKFGEDKEYQEYIEYSSQATVNFDEFRLDDLQEENIDNVFTDEDVKAWNELKKKLINLEYYSHICKV